MKGTRPLEDYEIEKIREYFLSRNDVNANRDMTLFFFALYSGFRISEILSIKVEDVFQYDKISDSVYLKKSCTKGKKQGRIGVINLECKKLLNEYFTTYNIKTHLKLNPDMVLFWGRDFDTPLSRKRGWEIFKNAFIACELQGKLACHTSRKTFAKKCYEALDHNILDLQQAMGHQSISSTQSYISSNNEKIRNVLENLSF